MAASRRYSTIASRNLCPHANISEDGHRRVPGRGDEGEVYTQ